MNSAVQNIPTEEKPKVSVPDGYGMLEDVVLPQAKIEIIQDWVKQTRRTPRKPRHSGQGDENESQKAVQLDGLLCYSLTAG